MKKTTNYFILKDYLFLAIALTASIILLLQNNRQLGTQIRSWSLVLFDQFLPDFFNPLKTTQIKNENIYLKDALVKLYRQRNEHFDLKQENKHLREMLGLKQKGEFNYVFATVLARNPDKYPFTLLINIGWKDSIRTGDIAVNAHGLIGIVSECSKDFARISMICSPKNRIAVRSEKERVPGILYPVDDLSAEVKEITKTQKVTKGEKIYTSGFSTIYPDGLLIGELSAASDSSATIHKYLKVRYAVNFTVLEDLFVIKSK